MKFGKYLALRQLELPEYAGHFIDYKALKKLIKHLSGENDSTLSSEKLQDNKAQFFFRVERELDKVNSFYLEKQANLAVTLDLLIMRKTELLEKKDQINDTVNPYIERSSTFKNSISYLSLYQNFKKLHQDLVRLQHFIELNETGFLKVVKKWDKRSKLHTRELFILSAVSVQPVFHKNEINELSDLVTQCLFDLESLVEGDFSSLPSVSTSVSTSSELPGGDSSGPGASTDARSRRSSFKELIPGRHQSIIKVNDDEIDGLYSSFINVATMEEDVDLELLVQWVERVKESSKTTPVTPGRRGSQGSGASTLRFKYSKVFLLAINNLRIPDSFLKRFLELIDYNIDFEFYSEDLDNKNLIHECCLIPLHSRHEVEHQIINNGVKVPNAYDSIKYQRTFIVQYVVDHCDPDMLRKLLTAKAFNGRTCLHYAAQYNRNDLLDLVLPHFPKTHIDVLDNESMSALLLAIKYSNFDIITKLLGAGANCFPQNNENTPQYLPVNYACKFGNFQILEYILSYRQSGNRPSLALLNQQDVEGMFPLHTVARSGHCLLIKLLIEHGADVNQIDGLNHWPPIFYSALEGHVKTTQELVELGAKLDIVDQDGYNVLYYCFLEGHILVINELLRYGEGILGKPVTTRLRSSSKSTNTSKSRSRSGSSRISPKNHFVKNVHNILDSNMIVMDEDMDSEDSGDPKTNMDAIPDLQLPPPSLPLRRYGHNFLEQKVLIELVFPLNGEFIKLFNSLADLKPGRITLTSNVSGIIPRNIQLPITEDSRNDSNCIFQTDAESLHEFRIDFEIFPKFGTRIIAKTTALSFSEIDTNSPEIASIQLPLFDLRLRNIGEIKLNYQIIFPFAGSLLETSKFDTYWKSSTSFVKNKGALKLNAAGGLSPSTNFSVNNGATSTSIATLIDDSTSSNYTTTGGSKNTTLTSPTSSNGGDSNNGGSGAVGAPVTPSAIVTATSLSGEYLRLKLCLLSDGTPIVCPYWSIGVTENIDLYLPNLTLRQLATITNDLFDYDKVLNDLGRMTSKDILLIKKLLRIIYLPLDIVLDALSFDINLNLEIIFPSQHELEVLPIIGSIELNLNSFVDGTLNSVFNHIRNHKVKGHSGVGRSIIFLSSNSMICKILNWKQPNFPVFLIMNGIKYNPIKKTFDSRSTNGLLLEEMDIVNPRSALHKSELVDQENSIRSIKEAINFTMNNNLIGLILSVHVLNLVPKLITLIRSRGLVLVASSDSQDDYDIDDGYLFGKDLDTYTKTDVNGLRFDDILRFKEDISM